MRLTFEAGSCHFCSFWLHRDKIKLWQVTHKMSWPARAEQTLWNVRVEWWDFWSLLDTLGSFSVLLQLGQGHDTLEGHIQGPIRGDGVQVGRRDRRDTVGVTERGAVVGAGHGSGLCRHRAELESGADTGKGSGKKYWEWVGDSLAFCSWANHTREEHLQHELRWWEQWAQKEMGTWA